MNQEDFDRLLRQSDAYKSIVLSIGRLNEQIVDLYAEHGATDGELSNLIFDVDMINNDVATMNKHNTATTLAVSDLLTLLINRFER